MNPRFLSTLKAVALHLIAMQLNQACSKRRATAVPNSNEFGPEVARR